MSKNLLIVESPAKAKTIEKYLGEDFEVKSCYGHIRDLEKDKMGINIKNNYLNGVETLYNHNGTRYRVTTYKNGIRHGRTQYFNFDGTIRDSYKYKNGKLFDKSYYYDPEDELRIVYHYKNGQRIKAVEYRKGLIDVIHFYKNNYLAYTNTIHYFEE